ncbi:hypothetical protein SAY86_020339 [Trapa natans]|uniref:Uncharacterized protein n=1 Tax=Trapa natans TaxID=22666 RepID=A0AAN7R5G9_TRANT|nr:hypothetical protein SAY86_020339 [Trapa natans]
MVIIPVTHVIWVLLGLCLQVQARAPSVHEGDDVRKYIISSRFAFIHINSYADIIAIEVMLVGQIDPLVQKGLTEFTHKLGYATTDLEKAEALIGMDVHSALNSILTA